jgi:hypothetical protein
MALLAECETFSGFAGYKHAPPPGVNAFEVLCVLRVLCVSAVNRLVGGSPPRRHREHGEKCEKFY